MLSANMWKTNGKTYIKNTRQFVTTAEYFFYSRIEIISLNSGVDLNSSERG